MRKITPLFFLFVCLFFSCFVVTAVAQPIVEGDFEIRVEQNHPWRPPFGLDRIGGPITLTITQNGPRLPARGFHLDSYRHGEIIQQEVIQFPEQVPKVVRKELHAWPDEIVLWPAGSVGKETETFRQKIQPPRFEAEARARPETTLHPVDLGAILFPEDRLLLGPDQEGVVEVAAISRDVQIRDVLISVWFESDPANKTSKRIELLSDKRMSDALDLPTPSEKREQDVIRVVMYESDGKELWSKSIPVRRVIHPPELPAFGATELKLDYELPIAIYKEGEGGAHTTINYKDGWDPEFNDIVVSFPNGARFVFWRGASYIPFWAGRHNTGFTYEWAESAPPAEGGYVDAVEPLMDKELRYSRVEILESTAARVHIRWTYQSCDFNYKVWGDMMQEDFYFYPDGFGTRVVTLKSTPGIEFELSELIVLSAAKAYPMDILPANLIDIIFLDGEKRPLHFPQRERAVTDFVNPNGLAPLYRIRIHRDETLTPIYYSPWDRSLPYRVYLPFEDEGEVVTMAYWGSHWPLSRGQNTGHRKKINEGIHFAPAHNSLMTWGSYRRPEPLVDETFEGIDALGVQRQMQRQVWSWLIGMTDANDAELLDRAKSYGTAPPLDIKGASAVNWSYEQRSFRIKLESDEVRLELIPQDLCVNPAFEFTGHTGHLSEVKLDGVPLSSEQYRWDGKLLWLQTKLTKPAVLELAFGNP